MANLHVYELTSPGGYEAISEDGALSNPVTTTHDGKTGEITEMKLYVGRDNVSSYSNIRVSATSTAGDLVEIYSAGGASRGTSGWGVKLWPPGPVDPGYDPREKDWDDTKYGTTIEIADIDSSIKRSFWYKIESPAGIRVENKTSISLILQFVEAP